MHMHQHTTRIRSFAVAGLMAVALALGSGGPLAADPPQWQPMLAKSFKVDARDLHITALLVNRNVGCVFLRMEAGGVYCSPAGAENFRRVSETWGQVSALRTTDLKHLFVLTESGIKESPDGGATWSKPIPPPRDFVITGETWFEYDAAHDVLYLMKAGSDLYKLPRGK
jgi:hypothetical protein